MAGNCNFAVAHTSRPYVAILHHDDLFKKDLLEQWASKLEKYPEAGFVFNAYETFDTKKISSIFMLKQVGNELPKWQPNTNEWLDNNKLTI
jgi:GT2 family glycosyltransferase